MISIPLFKVRVNKELVFDRLESIFHHGWIGQGPAVEAFEKQLSDYFESPVITTNSCTSALSLAFEEVAKTCDTVLTTPLTCFATTAAILKAGLKIKWVDLDPNTLNMDQKDLSLKHQDGDAISLIHFAGRPCRLSLQYYITSPVVEDCAHAFGTLIDGAPLNNDPRTFRCYSFQAVKTLTTGDGGALLPPKRYYQKLKNKTWYGMDRKNPDRNQDIREVGLKCHMNDVAATFGIANFDLALQSLKQQRENAKFFSKEIPEISLPFCNESSYWLYPVMVENRDGFVRKLQERGIQSEPAHYRNDNRSCVKEYQTPLPGMDIVEQNMTCIPNGWWVAQEEREYIVDVIREGW